MFLFLKHIGLATDTWMSYKYNCIFKKTFAFINGLPIPNLLNF